MFCQEIRKLNFNYALFIKGPGMFFLMEDNLTLILPIFLVLKMSSAYCVYCIYSNALLKTYTREVNLMKPDQAAPKGSV